VTEAGVVAAGAVTAALTCFTFLTCFFTAFTGTGVVIAEAVTVVDSAAGFVTAANIDVEAIATVNTAAMSFFMVDLLLFFVCPYLNMDRITEN
jgi:hypothetical protein